MTLNSDDYLLCQVEEVPKAAEYTEPLTVMIKCQDKATITFTGANLETAHDFPLATQYSEFLFIRLSKPLPNLAAKGGHGARNRKALRGHIQVLLNGRRTPNIQPDGHKLPYDDQQALRVEIATQDERASKYSEILSFFP